MKVPALRWVPAAFATATMLATAPALADYKICMTHCMTEHDFDYCHAICADKPKPTDEPSATQMENAATATASPSEICKLTDQEQHNLVTKFIYENYGAYPNITLSDDDQTVFQTEYSPTDEECRGVVKITSDCEVVRHEKFHCEWTGWTQEEEREQERKDHIVREINTAIRNYFRSKPVLFPDHAGFFESRNWRDLPLEVVNIEPERIQDIRHEYSFKVTTLARTELDSGQVLPGGLRCTVDVIVFVHGYRVKELISDRECEPIYD